MAHSPETPGPDRSQFHAADPEALMREYAASLQPGETRMDAGEAAQLSAQIADRLPGLLRANTMVETLAPEDAGGARDGLRVVLDRAANLDMFAGSALAAYDEIYATTAIANLGPEYLIEGVTQTPQGLTARFVRMSMEEVSGVPVAGTINSATGKEDTHPLTLDDALFAQDIMQALEAGSID